MPHTPPDPTDLQERYPAFAEVAAETIQYWLDDAARTVTDSWAEADYAPALMALAAHGMAVLGVVGGAGAAGGLNGVSSFRSGSFEAVFSNEAMRAAVRGGHAATPYGQEFAIYLRRNRGGPRVTGRSRLGCSWPS